MYRATFHTGSEYIIVRVSVSGCSVYIIATTFAEFVVEAVVEEMKLWLVGLLVHCSYEYPTHENYNKVIMH